jgi:heme/copper-type cytochrome/quinol oxidase subunit 3
MTQEGLEQPKESKSTLMPILIAAGATVLLLGVALYGVFANLKVAALGFVIPTAGLIILALGILNVFKEGAEEKFSEPADQTTENWPLEHLNKEKVGIWVFLTSEILLFGGLLVAYAYVRANSTFWPDPLTTHDPILGMSNTIILLTSSLAMILAFYFTRLGNSTGTKVALASTFGLGFTFLVVKLGFEWPAEIRSGFTINSGLPASTYYTLTGVHAMHIAIGLIAVAYLMFRAFNNQFTKEKNRAIENVGLYWHFVDIVWMFLFTIFYLV